MKDLTVHGSASFSYCERFRYSLYRTWDDGRPELVIIGLNPSTADAKRNDQNIRRCMKLAYLNGFGGILMLNLFARRETFPKNLSGEICQFEASNVEFVRKMLSTADAWVCAAWGSQPRFKLHILQLTLGYRLWCFGTTKDGSPRHPSRLPNSARLLPYNFSESVANHLLVSRSSDRGVS